MKLNVWMNGPPKWTNEAMGSSLEIDPSYISQIRNGRIPSVSLAKKISEFTNGSVSVAELLDIKGAEASQ